MAIPWQRVTLLARKKIQKVDKCQRVSTILDLAVVWYIMHQLVKQFSRLACFKSKVQLLGRMVARGGKAKSEALMILVRGKQIEGGVYSCSAYEQYHLKSQKCSSKRWIKKHERISRFNDSTAVHTSYPNLQVSNPILTQEGALLKRNPSDCDITLEEGVSIWDFGWTNVISWPPCILPDCSIYKQWSFNWITL